MKIKFVYGILPAFIFYVKTLGDFAAGRSNGFIIRVVEKYKDDEGLLEHELQHCRQFYRTLGIHGLLYKFSKKYRYEAEVEAYRIQLKYCQDKKASIRKFAEFLSTKYNLDVTKTKALIDLS